MSKIKTNVTLSNIMKTLGNETRIAILSILANVEVGLGPKEIARRLKEVNGIRITEPGIIKHLNTLRRVGLIKKTLFAPSGMPYPPWSCNGPKRISLILDNIRTNTQNLVNVCLLYAKTERLGSLWDFLNQKDKEQLKILLQKFDNPKIWDFLTNSEKKKIMWWKRQIEWEQNIIEPL